MALYSVRLRRALSLSSSLLHGHFHSPNIISPIHSITPSLSAILNAQSPETPHLSELQSFRHFRSSTISLSSRRQRFDDDMEITEDTILFEGCDYNHWLITVDFTPETTAQEKILHYEQTAAKVFGSMEEAKKRIYACSTTVYNGFQVECSEETSEKFKDLPGVVFVLPDSYIDPVNKQYGGDKYDNGQIIPRPPPISYVKRDPRTRQQRNDNRRPMQGYENRGQMPGEARNFESTQRNFGTPQNPPHQQNFTPQGDTRNFGYTQQNFGTPQNPPHQQDFSHPQNPIHHQNFGYQQNPAHHQNFGHQQNPAHHQNFGHQQNPAHHQNFGYQQNPAHHQNFGHQQNPAHHQNFGPSQNPSFRPNFVPHRDAGTLHNHPLPQNAPPHQNYGVQQNFSPQQNPGSPGMHFPGQQSYGPPRTVGHKDPTFAPGVKDHYEAGRNEFPQGDQSGYTSANDGSIKNQSSIPSQSGSFGQNLGGTLGQEPGPAYGHPNYPKHGVDKHFSEVEQSKVQEGEQRSYATTGFTDQGRR